MIGRSRSRFIFSVSAARAAPIPKAPVSPMMMRAGAAFHQRNPAHAPVMAMDTRARSRPCLTW